MLIEHCRKKPFIELECTLTFKKFMSRPSFSVFSQIRYLTVKPRGVLCDLTLAISSGFALEGLTATFTLTGFLRPALANSSTASDSGFHSGSDSSSNSVGFLTLIVLVFRLPRVS